MGLRLRLRGDFPVNNLPRQARVIAIAMQRYGIIVADNGTPVVRPGRLERPLQ